MFEVRILTGADGGGIQALPLSVRAGLFAALATLAAGTLLLGARAQWRAGDAEPGAPLDSEQWWRAARVLLPLEAAVGLVALVSAAILGGGAPTPAAAPAVAATAGPSLLLTTAGAHLVPVAFAPGLPGPNRVVVGVQDLDADGVAQPAAGVVGVRLRLRCDGCGAAATTASLLPTGTGPWFAGTVTLPAGTWTLTPLIDAPGAAAARPVTAAITPPRPGELLVGVPADLSGPSGGPCQNRALGLELALAGAADAPPSRVVLEDAADGGAAAATARLAGLGVHLLAAPCGSAATLSDVATAASRLHLPLVGALRSEGASPWVWRTGIDQDAEGAALARRVQAGGAGDALVLVGPRPEQATEAA
ncbi:MAG TPA: hypothetical protein VH134_14825, partial [Candidatus Dormibacteraeota bacterium]|nr:hypothetical protein [Candidatus Dormibacteraeota bacterium]